MKDIEVINEIYTLLESSESKKILENIFNISFEIVAQGIRFFNCKRECGFIGNTNHIKTGCFNEAIPDRKFIIQLFYEKLIIEFISKNKTNSKSIIKLIQNQLPRNSGKQILLLSRLTQSINFLK